MSAQPDEIQGNPEANNLMKIEYCGGWGYHKYVVALVAKIEELFGAGQFIYHIYRDAGVTGRFEVTVFHGSKTENGSGKVVHSKKASGTYVHADYPAFMAALEESLKWSHWGFLYKELWIITYQPLITLNTQYIIDA